ncbi:MAG: hypothetical protein JSW60_01575 [Thermoplasmatales archaeon]|nr:MAG: hypothetical protein JSW60_01575 [Thermoplasmatales archaeon]
MSINCERRFGDTLERKNNVFTSITTSCSTIAVDLRQMRIKNGENDYGNICN